MAVRINLFGDRSSEESPRSSYFRQILELNRLELANRMQERQIEMQQMASLLKAQQDIRDYNFQQEKYAAEQAYRQEQLDLQRQQQTFEERKYADEFGAPAGVASGAYDMAPVPNTAPATTASPSPSQDEKEYFYDESKTTRIEVPQDLRFLPTTGVPKAVAQENEIKNKEIAERRKDFQATIDQGVYNPDSINMALDLKDRLDERTDNGKNWPGPDPDNPLFRAPASWLDRTFLSGNDFGTKDLQDIDTVLTTSIIPMYRKADGTPTETTIKKIDEAGGLGATNFDTKYNLYNKYVNDIKRRFANSNVQYFDQESGSWKRGKIQ